MNINLFVKNFALQFNEPEPELISIDTELKDLEEWSSLTFNPKATILPKLNVGAYALASVGSTVIKNVKPETKFLAIRSGY